MKEQIKSTEIRHIKPRWNIIKWSLVQESVIYDKKRHYWTFQVSQFWECLVQNLGDSGQIVKFSRF